MAIHAWPGSRIVATFFLLAALLSGSCLAADAFSPEKLLTTWRDNEKSHSNSCITWRASLRAPLSPADVEIAKLKKQPIPPIDARDAADLPASLKISGDKYRFTTIVFRSTANVFTKAVPLVTAYDSKVRYTLMDGALGLPARGAMDLQPASHSAREGSMLAPNLLFRPFVSGLFSKDAKPRVAGKPVAVDGRLCFPVLFPSNDATLSLRIWADCETLFPVQLQSHRETGLHRETFLEATVTLKYNGIPRPESLLEWEYSLYSSGNRLMETASAQRIEVHRDCEVNDKDFTIDYPAGTHVADKRSGEVLELISQGNGELVPRPKPSK